eukprot:9637191-Karenia_brevis.AAC.1
MGIKDASPTGFVRIKLPQAMASVYRGQTNPPYTPQEADYGLNLLCLHSGSGKADKAKLAAAERNRTNSPPAAGVSEINVRLVH